MLFRNCPWNFNIVSRFVLCDAPLLSGVPFPDSPASFKDGTFSVNFDISYSVQTAEFDFFWNKRSISCAEAVSFTKGLGLPPTDVFFFIVPEKPSPDVLSAVDFLVPDRFELVVFPSSDVIVLASLVFVELVTPVC